MLRAILIALIYYIIKSFIKKAFYINNTALEIIADCYIPLDVTKYYDSLRKGTGIDTLSYLKSFIPLDIRNIFIIKFLILITQ